MFKSLLDLVYPRSCISCNAKLYLNEDFLCLGCKSELPFTNFHQIPENPLYGMLASHTELIAASSWLYFKPEGSVQKLMHELKYQSNRKLGIWLGQKFGEDLRGSALAADLDYIIPVPLHKKKERKRGYNQSALLARGLAETLGVELRTDLLLRTRFTETQTKKSREERASNLAGAFSMQSPQAHKGKKILLVDDVVTTGSTLLECIRALSKADLKVSACTLGISLEI